MSFGAACITMFGGGVFACGGAAFFGLGIKFVYMALTAERI